MFYNGGRHKQMFMNRMQHKFENMGKMFLFTVLFAEDVMLSTLSTSMDG